MIVAERLGRYDTIGIDCVAMNANDVICVGAEPIAMLDFVLTEKADPEICRQLGIGLARGAELAGIEIPGGEIAQVAEIVSGQELGGTCVGLVELEAIVAGAAVEPGDPVIGLPSSGLHSNGYTLARRALAELSLDDSRLGRPLGDVLLEPTEIYVRAILDLLASPVEVRGLVHITGDGVDNLLRLQAECGYEIDDPLTVPPVFELIQSWRAYRTPRWTRSSTWGAASAASWPAPTRGPRWSSCAATTRRRSGLGGPPTARVRCSAGSLTAMRIAIVIFDRLTALDAVGPYEVLRGCPEPSCASSPQQPGRFGPTRGPRDPGRSRARELPDPDVVLVPGGGEPRLDGDSEGARLAARGRSDLHLDDLGLHRLAGPRSGRDPRRQGGRRPIGRRWSGSVSCGAEPSPSGWSRTASSSPRPGCRPGSTWRSRLVARIAGDKVAEAIQLGIEYDIPSKIA